MNEGIYIKDLENRFPAYAFVETAIGNLIKFEAKEGENVIVSNIKCCLEEAIFCVRENLVGGKEILPMLTTLQITALTGICEGTNIFDSTTKIIKICTSSAENLWE